VLQGLNHILIGKSSDLKLEECDCSDYQNGTQSSTRDNIDDVDSDSDSAEDGDSADVDKDPSNSD
jgi:hypothetical protein